MMTVTITMSRMTLLSKSCRLSQAIYAPFGTITGNSIRSINYMATGQNAQKNCTSLKSIKTSMPIISTMDSGVCFSSKSEDKNNATNDNNHLNEDGPHDHEYEANDRRFKDGKPTLAYATVMPKDYSTMRHEQILHLFAEGVPEASCEAAIRDIMSVDQVEYDDAVITFSEIKRVHREWMWVDFLPYKFGLGTAVVSGVVSFPMVFHLGTVTAFNEKYVTADIPEPKDLETWLEVGSWSWAWMEPLIGQISFALLVAQFARIQMVNLGIKPYGNLMKNRRADRLVRLFPQYNAKFLRGYSVTQEMFD